MFDSDSYNACTLINPATGYVMVEGTGGFCGTGGFDVAGNPYGCDFGNR